MCSQTKEDVNQKNIGEKQDYLKIHSRVIPRIVNTDCFGFSSALFVSFLIAHVLIKLIGQ